MTKMSSKYSGYQNAQFSRSKPANTDEKASTFLNTNSPRKEINKPINWQGEVPSLRGKKLSRNTEESKMPSNKLKAKTKILSSSDSSCKQIILILFSKWRKEISHKEK